MDCLCELVVTESTFLQLCDDQPSTFLQLCETGEESAQYTMNNISLGEENKV
jgi:hypothetical protein